MVLSCGPALATALYPEAKRTRILGLYTMVFGIGGVLGSVLAGVLVQAWGWQAVFWFRAPISLAAFVLALALPRDAPRGGKARFDGLGALLLVLAVSTMLLALNQLQHPDEPMWLLAPAAVALIAAAGFVAWERRTAQPLIDLRFFRDRDFALVNAANVAVNLSGFAVMLLVPFYLDRFGRLSVPASGAVLTASGLGIILASPLAGRLAAFVPPRRLALLGVTAMAMGQMLVGSAGTTPHLAVLICGMALQGAGLGLFQVAYLDIVTAAIPRQDRGVAGSLVMMTRTVGTVTGATVLMLVFQRLRASTASDGLAQPDAFMAGFQGAFHAAAIPLVAIIAAALAFGWARGRARA